MGKETLPRREREKLRQRREILAAAYDLFSEKGYHGVSMHEIAKTAEFAIGTLYKLFQNKEDLYKALVLDQCDKFEETITHAIEEPDDEVEKLRNFIRTKRKSFHGNLPFIRLFLAECKGASFNINAGLDDELRKRHYTFLKKLTAIFESGIKNKRFKMIADPFHLAVALDSVLDAFFLLHLDMPEIHPDPEVTETILDIFLNGLVFRQSCQSPMAEYE
ncbi:MAG: TetR/AcrR family transcriptional regulator [Deltaproteobacteria bacterium]|nr:TetR/AcrR family transcriptional regulator [Deltaproteobacteria bacterium]